MQTVFTVFERNPENDHTGILTGIYTSKDIALETLTKNCQEGEAWAAAENEKFPGLGVKFSNCYFTVSEDVLQDGTPVESEEYFNFHQWKRYFQKFDWDGTKLVPTNGVPVDITSDW